MAAPGSATCPANISTGQPLADVIMAVDDVSVNLVNFDQVNGSTRVHVQESVGPTCRSLGVTDRQDPHVRLGLKKKEKATKVNRLKGGSGRFSSPTWLGDSTR